MPWRCLPGRMLCPIDMNLKPIVPRRITTRHQVLPAGASGPQSHQSQDSSSFPYTSTYVEKKAAGQGAFPLMLCRLVLTAQLPQTLNRRELGRRIRQFRLSGCVFEVRARVLQRLFSTLACVFSLGFVKILAADCCVGENRHCTRLDFEN